MKQLEGTFKSSKGINLYYQKWQPDKFDSTLVVTHGLGEHSDWYNLLAKGMAPHGWRVIAWDLPGHGRSDGKRGHIDSFQIYLEDLKVFCSFLESEKQIDGRTILLGHSMGGLVTSAAVKAFGFMGTNGMTLSSPLFDVALQVPWIKEKASSLLYKYLPDLTLHNEIADEILSRDPEVVALYKKDPLRHTKISPSLYHGMKTTMLDMKSSLVEFGQPVYIQAAGRDRVVSLAATEKFFENMKCTKKELKVFSNSYHEIYNDLDREQAYSELNKWWRTH